MEVNNNEVKKILTLEEIRHLKQLACQKQMYELAACAREHEKYLMTDEGKKWSYQQIAKIKAEKRRDKLSRIFLSDK